MLGKREKILIGKASVPLENAGDWPLSCSKTCKRGGKQYGFTAVLKISQFKGDDKSDQNLCNCRLKLGFKLHDLA